MTLAELVFAITHEGAYDVDDLLDRRTRVGLIEADRAAAEPLAERALELVRRRWRSVTQADRQNRSVVRSIHGQDAGLVGSFSTARPLPTPCGKGRPVHFLGSACRHSTVTDFARLRGLSMSWPRCFAAW